MDEIITKYLLGEASSVEREEIDQWLNQSEANRKHFRQLSFIWEESKKVGIESNLDEDTAWKKFEHLLEETPDQNRSVNPAFRIGITKRKFLQFAAAAMLVITFGWLGYLFFRDPGTSIASSGKVLIETLPDRSVVTLNKNSTLTYPASFNRKERRVVLKGEAFFKVAPNKQKPFEIEVNNIQVQVVGTSFNIKSDESGTEIIVETGIVKVSTKHHSVELLPHQRIRIAPNSSLLQVQENRDELYNYYRTNQFICNNTPLSQLVDALNSYFNVNIQIVNPDKGRLRLTTEFNNEDLSEILKIISVTLDLKVANPKKGLILIK